MARRYGKQKGFLHYGGSGAGSPPFPMRYAGEFSAREGRHSSKAPRYDKPVSCPCKSAPIAPLIFHVMATQKAVFPRDTGLQARILLTLFLLGLLYVVFIAVLLSAGAGASSSVVVVMGGLLAGRSCFFSDKLALVSDGRQGRHAAGGAGPSRDDREALHPGGSAQAAHRRG